MVLLTRVGYCQEINAQVTIQTPKLQTVDPRVFKTLQTDIREFLNGRKWTDDNFSNNERIDLNVSITIIEEVSPTQFKAQATIQGSRPVYNSNYKSVTFNYLDKTWDFEYVEFQPLEYNETGYLSELTSLLAFYTYIVIGLDYDSFSAESGTPFYTKAQNIINNASNNLGKATSKGWRGTDGMQSRYSLVQELTNNKYKGFRQSFYKYHRLGLDQMYDKPSEAYNNISQVIKNLEKLRADYPTLMLLSIFLNAKGDEIATMHTDPSLPQPSKMGVYNSMMKLDAAGSAKYDKIKNSTLMNDMNNGGDMLPANRKM